ncbi:tumor necrosis factor receptor superfamily member 9 isoform X1 [Peromyscus eremicus]|uniref:tumor necrosis factor receptor superfamily member 9 isoform X1 n=1 Tax=Peromyscus eremicus TaxID=42410 RepID=UPI0027DD9268|nr:tumor necrosis factor receptor superfamily member 9 isoform X1 [Peromyscus eremicus]
MGNGCHMVVTVLLLLLLLVVGTERTRALRDSCDKCEAGTFCKKDNPVCTSCPPSTYSIRGGQPYCNICKVCGGYFRFKKPCSPTSDAECECTEGLHCLGPKCARCEKDCKPGQELTEQGCKICGFGTFNNQNGGGSCRPWTNCSLGGKSVLENGTKEKDVVCGPDLASLSPGTSPTAVPAPGGLPLQVLTVFLALTSAIVLFLLFIILWLLVARWSGKKFPYIFKQPFKMVVRTAQEEDACSCRFPEEEEGGSYEM